MSQASTPDTPSEEVASAAKRPYHAPDLRTMGSMADLTEASTNPGPNADATYNNMSS
jgi:hypothetical protein